MGFECQGDTVIFTCIVRALSNEHTVTWVVTYPGLPPIMVSHNNVTASDVNSTLPLDVNSLSTLTKYKNISIRSKHFESNLALRIRNYVSSVRVQCTTRYLERSNPDIVLTVSGIFYI